MDPKIRLQVQRALGRFVCEYPGSRLTASSVARTLNITADDAVDAMAWLAESGFLKVVVESRCVNTHKLDDEPVDAADAECIECGSAEIYRFATYEPLEALAGEVAASTGPKDPGEASSSADLVPSSSLSLDVDAITERLDRIIANQDGQSSIASQSLGQQKAINRKSGTTAINTSAMRKDKVAVRALWVAVITLVVTLILWYVDHRSKCDDNRPKIMAPASTRNAITRSTRHPVTHGKGPLSIPP